MSFLPRCLGYEFLEILPNIINDEENLATGLDVRLNNLTGHSSSSRGEIA